MATLLGTTAAQAQAFPSQPIKIINPYAPGGAVEVMVRAFAQKLAGTDWPPIVNENRPGASGTIAALATKQAAPDGYTLMAADTVSHALAISLVENLAYDPVKDFTPITLMWTFPTLLAVPTSSPAQTVTDLVELARRKAGGLAYASQGTGSAGHVLGALLQKAAGAPMSHVPYRGAGPAMPDLVSGRVDFMFSSVGTIQPFVQSGKLRVLANSSKERLNGAPSMTELGYPDVHYEAWFGLLGPARLDAAIVKTLRERAIAALSAPDLVETLHKAGLRPRPTTPEQMRELIQNDIKRLAPIVRDTLTKQN
jgi:tripartite-type tricarboxylate transporter receptor subunit TctC